MIGDRYPLHSFGLALLVRYNKYLRRYFWQVSGRRETEQMIPHRSTGKRSVRALKKNGMKSRAGADGAKRRKLRMSVRDVGLNVRAGIVAAFGRFNEPAKARSPRGTFEFEQARSEANPPVSPTVPLCSVLVPTVLRSTRDRRF